MKIQKGYKQRFMPHKIYKGEKWQATVKLFGENSNYKRGKTLDTEVIDFYSEGIYEREDKWSFFPDNFSNYAANLVWEYFSNRIQVFYELINEPHPEREEEKEYS